jgi:hypothetical protein
MDIRDSHPDDIHWIILFHPKGFFAKSTPENKKKKKKLGRLFRLLFGRIRRDWNGT